jgi:hypothetical protein
VVRLVFLIIIICNLLTIKSLIYFIPTTVFLLKITKILIFSNLTLAFNNSNLHILSNKLFNKYDRKISSNKIFNKFNKKIFNYNFRNRIFNKIINNSSLFNKTRMSRFFNNHRFKFKIITWTFLIRR